MPKLQYPLWLCLAAYGILILKEFVFDWRNWARHGLHLPAEWTRGRFSPGVLTAVLLFPPLSIYAIRTAGLDTVSFPEELVIGAVLMAAPILFLRLKSQPYFDGIR